MCSAIHQEHVHVISHSPRACSCDQPFTKSMFMSSAIHQEHVHVFSYSPRACSCVQNFQTNYSHYFRNYVSYFHYCESRKASTEARFCVQIRPFKRTECISPGVGSSVLGLRARDCSSRKMFLCSDKRQCGRLCDGKRDCSNGEDEEFCRNVLYYVDCYKLIESATH